MRRKSWLSFSADLNYQPNLATNVWAFWSRSERSSRLNNIADGGFSPDPTAGGAVYPLDRAWRETADDDSTSYGIGASFHALRGSLSSSLSVSDSTSEIAYSYASPGALATPNESEPGSAGAYPDIEHDSVQWVNELAWRFPNDTELTLYHRYDRVEIDDWHFDGLMERVGNQLYLGVDLGDYEVHSVGVSVNYSF